MGGLAEVGHFPQGRRFDPLYNPTLPTKCFAIEQMHHKNTCAPVRVKGAMCKHHADICL